MNSMKDKRSLHSTVGASSKKPPATKSRINLIIYIVSGFIVVAISVCCLGIIFFKYQGNGTPTPSTQTNILTSIASTSIASQKQTMPAAPVASSTQFIIPSVTLAPSFTPIPSNTPFFLPKMKIPTIIPTFTPTIIPTKVPCCVYCSGNLPQPCGNSCIGQNNLCTIPAGHGCACKK